jgi:hypothetical protein
MRTASRLTYLVVAALAAIGGVTVINTIFSIEANPFIAGAISSIIATLQIVTGMVLKEKED